MKHFDRATGRPRKQTLLAWILVVLVGSMSPTVPALAGSPGLLIEPVSEPTGGERDDAGSAYLTQTSARRTEWRHELSGGMTANMRLQNLANSSASLGTAHKQFGELLHRNGIGAPLRR